uniref:Uncharacterized protein n=1 Tax=Zea mays TaxID=4577 RepID=B6T0N7_MAIZE|nr:hypothetical protein [Zea mays]
MVHGGYPRRDAAVRRPKSSSSAVVADRKRKWTAAAKNTSLKNQIRSTERFLHKGARGKLMLQLRPLFVAFRSVA